MGALDSPLYFVVKLLAYCAWCYVGLRSFRPAASLLPLRAFVFGILRLFMGFFFGIVIYFLGSFLVEAMGSGLSENILTYLYVYVPIRWIEWSILSTILRRGQPNRSPWLFGENSRERNWRFGGILVSCLADIPLIMFFGGVIPTGRFLC
jgi:hypothetical protein